MPDAPATIDAIASGGETLRAVLMVMGVHVLAALTPGPDIALVLRNSLAHGRKAGVLTSVGIGIGNFTHVAWALLGFGVLILGTPWLVRTMQWAAGLYLVYLGVRGMRARPVSESPPPTAPVTRPAASRWQGRWLLQGAVSCSLNPKATLFYLSVFTVLLDPDKTPRPAVAALALYLPAASVALFSGVACLASIAAFRGALARNGHWLDRLIGVILIALGVSLGLSRVG